VAIAPPQKQSYRPNTLLRTGLGATMDTWLMPPGNLDLVRSIYAAWTRGQVKTAFAQNGNAELGMQRGNDNRLSEEWG
jgi:hypothetical protein